MAVRTNSTAVAKIIEVDTDIDLTPFIEASSMIVDRVCAAATDSDGSDYYNALQLEVIERWLSAHFYAIRDPRASYEAAGSVGAKYESAVDLNLNGTRYGGQAMLLDTHGGLAKLNKEMSRVRITPSVTWLGKKRCGT